MNWFKKLFPSKAKIRNGNGNANGKRGVPEGVWTQCKGCQAVLYSAELARHLKVCPKCQHHNSISARNRLLAFLDRNHKPTEIKVTIPDVDCLKFKDSKKYKDRLSAAQSLTGETDALVAMRGYLSGMGVVACAFDFRFIGGSMGARVGELFTQAVEESLQHEVPLICFSASGGARMQEGLTALMQMTKTSAALVRLSRAKLPFISVLTNPTLGGVSASLAMLGDIIIAEPGALIGFAGPRVISQTVKETLPEGFQRSEFLLKHGAIDMIVPRHLMQETIARLIAKLTHQVPPSSRFHVTTPPVNAETTTIDAV